MSKIRKYCKDIGLEVAGRLNYMGMWDHCNRWYIDEAGSAYLIDTVLGTIRIIRPRLPKALARSRQVKEGLP